MSLRQRNISSQVNAYVVTMIQLARFGAFGYGICYGFDRLEKLKALEAEGKLPHQQEGHGDHGHGWCWLEY